MKKREHTKLIFGKGFHPLIDKLFNRIPEENIFDIKSKYGRIDTTTQGLSDEDDDFCLEIERESENTCEVCGEKGELKDINGWITALCDKHYKERTKILNIK